MGRRLAASPAASTLPDRPRASVVIPRSRPGERIDDCLDALAAGTISDYEAIVVDSTSSSESGEGATRILHAEQRLPPHEARNRGAELARGEAIVFTDADCVPRPDWLERLLEAHGSGAALVGGSVDPDGGRIVERGADICKFAPWLEGLPAGTRETLPTANLSLTRDTWERIGPFRLLAWSGDTEFCLRARDAGIPLTFEPRAVVRHDDPVRIGRFLNERWERGAAYASLRVEAGGWSRARCAAYALLSPLIALKLVARGALAAIRSGRAAAALVTLPVTAAGFSAWTLGEARSYLRALVSGSSKRSAPLDRATTGWR